EIEAVAVLGAAEDAIAVTGAAWPAAGLEAEGLRAGPCRRLARQGELSYSPVNMTIWPIRPA
ncbi:MAG: hypothetical protein ACREJS_00005, partial [Candidatus Rokuibacteriota bacterium]